MMRIINLTPDPATPEQIAAGVEDLPPEKRAELLSLMTFEEAPGMGLLVRRSIDIACLAEGFEAVLVGGPPFLTWWIQTAIINLSGRTRILYAFPGGGFVEG